MYHPLIHPIIKFRFFLTSILPKCLTQRDEHDMGTSPYLDGNGGNGMGKSWYLMISPAKQFLMTVKLMSRISELSAENTNHLRLSYPTRSIWYVHLQLGHF